MDLVIQKKSCFWFGELYNKRKTPELFNQEHVKAKIRFLNDTTIYAFRNNIYIGTDANRCHIIIDNPVVSRLHCLLSHDLVGKWYVIDLNSKNGTYIRRRNLPIKMESEKPFQLEDGDILILADPSKFDDHVELLIKFAHLL